MFQVGPQRIPLCLDCNSKLQNMLAIQNDQLARMINFFMDQADAAVPIPGSSLPRIQLPSAPIIQTGEVTLNNIHVTNSEIGVLNTGNLSMVDSNVTVLKNSGNDELADAVTRLTEAVVKSKEINEAEKNEIVELLGALSGEATAPKDQQKTSVVRVFIMRLNELLSPVATISALWGHAKTIFEQVVG